MSTTASRRFAASDRSVDRPGVDVRPGTQARPGLVPVGRRVVPGAAGRADTILGHLAKGPRDPTHRRIERQHWFRATRTPQGTALVEIADVGPDTCVRAWGDGGQWALEQAPRLLGCADDPTGFAELAAHAVVLQRAHRAHPNLRVGATDNLAEALAPAVIEQKVTGPEAFGGLRRLWQRHGEFAPGPAGIEGHPAYDMLVPPGASTWARIPSFEFTRAGVDARRAAALVRAMARTPSLERALGAADTGSERARLLQSLPGVGPWTAAKVLQWAYGDPDAWSTGDYHVPGLISLALCGTKLDNDDAAEVLRPYAGHRFRVELLVVGLVAHAARRGPRKALPRHVPGIGVPGIGRRYPG